MDSRWKDLEPAEKEFVEEFRKSLGALQQRYSDCPRPDVLLAARSGVLPSQSAAVAIRHLEACPMCQSLLRALDQAPFSEPNEVEEARTRARLLESIRQDSSRSIFRWFWRPVPIAVVAAFLAVFTALVWIPFRVQAPSPPVAQQTSPAEILQLEKLPVRISAAALLFRGEGSTEQRQFMEDLGQALEPYRMDDFTAAAVRLKTVADRYSNAVEPRLYLGISLLFLQRSQDAATTLMEARSFAQPPLADDVAWYLSIAQERSGAREAAHATLTDLCNTPNDYQARACAALTQFPAGK